MFVIATHHNPSGQPLASKTVNLDDVRGVTELQVQHLRLGLEVIVFAGRHRTDYSPLHPNHGPAGHGQGLGSAKFYSRRKDDFR